MSSSQQVTNANRSQPVITLANIQQQTKSYQSQLFIDTFSEYPQIESTSHPNEISEQPDSTSCSNESSERLEQTETTSHTDEISNPIDTTQLIETSAQMSSNQSSLNETRQSGESIKKPESKNSIIRHNYV